MTGDFLHLSPPHVGDTERGSLLAAFDSNWVAPAGPDLEAFERQVAAEVQVAHAVALSSGTAALHLGLQLAGVGRGEEVLVPSFTFAAKSFVWSSVALADACTIPKTTPWSSIGASSFCEKR